MLIESTKTYIQDIDYLVKQIPSIQKVNDLPDLDVEKSCQLIEQIKQQAESSWAVYVLRTAKKVAELIAKLLFGFGALMGVCSLLGILIDKPTTVKVMSVLNGMAIGCVLYILGSVIKTMAQGLVWLERRWINSGFNSMQEDQKKTLNELRQWVQLDQLTYTDKILKSIVKVAKPRQEDIQKACSEPLKMVDSASVYRPIYKKFTKFILIQKGLAEKPNGMEVLAYLRA